MADSGRESARNELTLADTWYGTRDDAERQEWLGGVVAEAAGVDQEVGEHVLDVLRQGDMIVIPARLIAEARQQGAATLSSYLLRFAEEARRDRL